MLTITLEFVMFQKENRNLAIVCQQKKKSLFLRKIGIRTTTCQACRARNHHIKCRPQDPEWDRIKDCGLGQKAGRFTGEQEARTGRRWSAGRCTGAGQPGTEACSFGFRDKQSRGRILTRQAGRLNAGENGDWDIMKVLSWIVGCTDWHIRRLSLILYNNIKLLFLFFFINLHFSDSCHFG